MQSSRLLRRCPSLPLLVPEDPTRGLCPCPCLHVLCCWSLEPHSLDTEGSPLLPAGTHGKGAPKARPLLPEEEQESGLACLFFSISGVPLGPGGEGRGGLWVVLRCGTGYEVIKFAVVCTSCVLEPQNVGLGQRLQGDGCQVELRTAEAAGLTPSRVLSPGGLI